jgi:hypothetical protein
MNSASRRTSPRLLGPEGPIAVAQLAADPTHRRLADRAQTGLPGEALDVAIGGAPDGGADDERLEWSRPDDRAGVGDDRTDEAFEGAPDLGHRDQQLALGSLDPPGSVTVARAGRLGRPRVAGPPEEGRQLVLDHPLKNELGAQASKLAQLVGAADPLEQDRLDGFLNPVLGAILRPTPWSPLRLARSALEPTPSSFLRRGQDATIPTVGLDKPSAG